MGYRILCLLLLLSSYTLAQESSDVSEQPQSCQLASRFKAYRKYLYRYTTESRNGVVGAADLRNGPKMSCQVEIEVPQACRFIMYTRDCALSEVSDMDPQGQPVYMQAPGAEAFQAAMEKNPLKISIEDVTTVKLYPEIDEPLNILNIKRGVISALIVPVMEDAHNSIMSTVHGLCLTDTHVIGRRDIPTDVTLSRDLSQCDQFHSRELVNSPLALLQKLHRPMSKLITSTQGCDYQFDNKGKHILKGTCTEKHVYLPFSYDDNGISSVVTQDLSFQNSKRITNRVFDTDPGQNQPLHFENPDDKAPIQTQDNVLSTMQDLVALTGTDQGQKRPGLFHKLVSGLRVLRNETLSQTVPEMLKVSSWLTWQALVQCGTSECTSAILQAIRNIDGVSLEVDALVYGLSLQGNPDEARVIDMLSMAQYKQSKAIMYALANTVKKFHKGEVTPVITDVSKFMEGVLNGCSVEVADYDTDPREMSFLVLRVVGVMGEAMQAASPSLISSILQCAQKTDIPLSNQKAAIQALRLMDINDEIRSILMDMYQDTQNSVEKRIAAYLILMKSPNQALIKDIVNNLEHVGEEELRSFVLSHLKNIHDSDDPHMSELKEYIELAITDYPFDGKSRNYKIDSPLGSARSNIIFDGRDTLPKEVMLETTLKVFDYNYDLFEVGIEGAGFEPTIDAIFGEDGFFPDTISKIMYWVNDKAQVLTNILDRVSPDREKMKRQVPQDLLKDITIGLQKLVHDIGSSQDREATAYLRLLGKEIGYLRTSEMRQLVETLNMYIHVFFRILPSQLVFSAISSTENEIFAHYIFMENAFSLPTASGFPLKFALAGVFTPGAKGGLVYSGRGGVTELSFMPSVGLEFITKMGVHIPDYVEAGLEMHTNMHHESSVNAEVTLNRNQVKLSIPAPKTKLQLFSISNNILSVSSGQTKLVPSLPEERSDSTDCQLLFTGMELCTILGYSDPASKENAPYFPLTGESMFAMEIRPTGDISAYTVTITRETTREGKKGRHKVDTLKLTLKAEGDDSTEATATVKYNHDKSVFTTEVVIPDYDVEAGIKLAVTDSDAMDKKMRGITLDITNRNIPQLTLVGRSRLDMMRDAMFQLQLIIPSLKTDAAVTAKLKRDEDVTLDLQTVITLPETSYQHRSLLRYDENKFEVELKSDLNSEIHKLIPNVENYDEHLKQLIDDILDQKVAKTDMKLRHIVNKAIEAGNIWLDKLTPRFPYLANLRGKRSIADLAFPAVPDKLFLQSDSLFRYQFNKDKMAISVPLPLGGKNTEELNIPTMLYTPPLDLEGIGLYIPGKTFPLPSFDIPASLDFTIPLLGLAEVSSKINSNLYEWEGSITGGNNTVDVPSYIVQCKAMAQSPLSLLSYKLEGIGMMSGRPDDYLKYLLDISFSHSLLDTSLSVSETMRVTNKLNAQANYKMEVSSPVGLQAALQYSAQSMSTLISDEVTGDGTLDGLLNIGSFNANTSYTQTYNLHPLDGEGKGESTLYFNLPFIQIHNRIQGVYANSELNIVSRTNTQKDIYKHVAELRYKDAQLTLKSNTFATIIDQSLSNKVELGVSKDMAIIRIESQADDERNRLYSQITGLLNLNGLELNSEGSFTFGIGRGLHKASVIIGENRLTTSGTNSIQSSPVIIENVFNGAMDSNGASLSCWTKAITEESHGELNIEGKVTSEEATLNGALKGNVYDATTRNNMDLVLNRQALKFLSNNMGSWKEMKTENSHRLILTLWTLALTSKTDSFICDDMYYKHDASLNMKPFVTSVHMTNDLKLYDANLKNEVHMKAEPIKMDLSGATSGAYREEHSIKHTYEITYNDMAGTLKYSTSGDIMAVQLNHNCELEFAGLSSRSQCEVRINSEPLHFDSTIRTMAVPLSITIDVLTNSDCDIMIYSKHTGQLYSRLLVKAEPLALAYSHDNRVSTTHYLASGETSTNLDSKCEGLLTPNNQYLSWKVISKLNNHAYNQEISTYNNPEKTGLEYSGVLSTNLFSKLGEERISQPDTQEFTVAGFLKYDKNSDCHIIHIPFIESLPAAFERLKNTLVQALESIQKLIKDININQKITDFRAKLDSLPEEVSDFMQTIDLENKVNQMKAKIDYLITEFAVKFEDLELSMSNLNKALESTVIDIATKIRGLILTIKENLREGDFLAKLTNILSEIGNQLQTINEKYEIIPSLIKALHAIDDIIRQINVEKLADTGAAWLQDLDSKFRIVGKIKDKLSELRQAIENFDISRFFQDLNDYLLSVDLDMYFEQLLYTIPTVEITNVIDSMNDVIVNWIDEYEIPNKLNTLHFYIRDLLLKYSLDDKFKELMDQIVILVKEFKIEETVQSVVDALRSINFEFVYVKVMEYMDIVSDQLRATDFRKSIDALNEQISVLLNSIKEFDYNTFVDEMNTKIAELTNHINEHIKTYEIVQKIEAMREFFREIQSSIFAYLDKLKHTRIAEALQKLKNLIDTTFYNDITMKMQEMLEDMRQRVIDMDIRNEIYIHLQRLSESYSNIIAYITLQFNKLMEIRVVSDNNITANILTAVYRLLDALKRAEIEVETFILPLTDLAIPSFTINLNKLQEINIPVQIEVPEFTILNSYTIPAFTIDFNDIKTKIVAFINDVKRIEIKWPDPEEIFGDLKVHYLSDLPDITLPEITLSEIKFPTLTIPKLTEKDFEITMLLIPEIKLPEVPTDICIPIFGKLHGELRVNSPMYTLVTTGMIENSTTMAKNPRFTATINSHASSPIELIEYNFEAIAQLSAPRMKKLLFTEAVKATHKAFSVNHEGSIALTSASAEASAKTTAKATTPMYTADLINNMGLTLKSGISADMNTTYSHDINIPSLETMWQASIKQNIGAKMESGKITMTGETIANGKWSIEDYFDEGTHTSNVDFNINPSTAKLIFTGETDCKALKSRQSLTAESVILNHINIEARCETECAFVKRSVMSLNGQANIGDLEASLAASHDAEFTGSLTGSMSNSLEFLAHPFEIVFDTKNMVNSRMYLPLKLTGKIDLQHDCRLILNPEKQHASWLAGARFNQYKYNHNFLAENNDVDIFLHLMATGEANVDFLTVPLSFPEMEVPYLEIKTPEVRDFSLWEQAGFQYLLTTPQQSFDMTLKVHYDKNPDLHSMELNLEPIYNTISDNANILQAQFEQARDKLVTHLKDSYERAKLQYVKHRIDTYSLPPRIFTVPGYKIPFLNIEVSAFSAEMPAFNYFVPKEVTTPSFKVPALGFYVPSYTLVLPSLQIPVVHVPDSLSETQLPTFTLPAIQNNIDIPAMGNLTCDFSFKSTVITISANAGLLNQSDIIARFSASSLSVFDVLNGKLDGTTSLTGKRGLKLVSTLSIQHNIVETNHQWAFSLTKRSLESSVTNNAKIDLRFLNLEVNHELIGNSNIKPTIVSTTKVKYAFYIPLVDSAGKGNLDMNWGLEALSSYVSLETSTQGQWDMTVIGRCHISGELENEASFYLNANRLRSTIRTYSKSNINVEEKQKRSTNNMLQFDLNKNLALEVSLKRMVATMDYMSNNNVESASFNTNGKYVVKGELDFIPLTTWKSMVDIDASQPSSLGDIGLTQNIKLDINSEKQSLTWSGKEHLLPITHSFEILMSNDESQVRLDLTESMEGHLAFLKTIKLPVYQRTAWDVLKFDQVTTMDNLQALRISYGIVYTKSMEGQEYAIPARLFEDGITLNIPEVSIAMPSWVKHIPQSVKSIDMRFETPNFSDYVRFPPALLIPAFVLPFTNLHVDSFTIDLKNLRFAKTITTKAFEIMIPGLPVISVPSYNIDTEYLQEKTSFLSFKIPQHEVTVLPFTLPKSFTTGEQTISLDDVTQQLSNFELPSIVIPQQQIEIPEVTLYLPLSVFVPEFGALSTTLKFSSPIYNISTTTALERNDSKLVASLSSICTSTMVFLEYDLIARAIFGLGNGGININGMCNLIHSDVNMNCQHVLTQNLRMRRQTSQSDSMESRQALSIDITSRTFTDISFRFASRKDGVTASVSSPSSGFLGLQFLQRSPSQLYGKLFSRYTSSPEKDVDVITAKATLKNAQKIMLQMSWNWDFLHDAIEGTKDRVPAMNNALLRFLNKYHTAHFGFDLNRGSMKLKNAASNAIERAYNEVPMTLNSLQSSATHLREAINVQVVTEKLAHNVEALKEFPANFMSLLNESKEFLNDLNFTMPGSEKTISLLDLFEEGRMAIRRAADIAIQSFASLIDKAFIFIREIEFTIPGTEFAINGNEIVEKLQHSARSTYDQLREALIRGVKMLEQKLYKLFKVIAEKANHFITHLNNEMVKMASEIDAASADFWKSAKLHIDKAKRQMAAYKDSTKLKIQDAYEGMNLETASNNTIMLIDIFQSHLYGGLNEGVDLMRRASQSTAPFVRVTTKKVDIEIPLPFRWKAFSDWPNQE